MDSTEELLTPSERSPFAGHRGPCIVLFHCGDAPALCQEFEATRWPRGYRRLQVDLTRDEEARSWFDVVDGAAVAVVVDGAVLALEYSCDAAARQRLLRAAEQQRRMLDEL